MSAHYESLPRCIGRQKPRQTSCYSVESQSESLPFSAQPQSQPKKSLPTGSSSGYELVYLARTGSRGEASEQTPGSSTRSAKSRFRVQSADHYVEMAGRQPSTYENVERHSAGPTTAASSVDDSSIYDIPRELGGSKAYENVSFNPPDSPHPTDSISSSPKSTTPDSPSQISNMPPTPDHPPPSAHTAEQRIHLRIRPLSEV